MVLAYKQALYVWRYSLITGGAIVLGAIWLFSRGGSFGPILAVRSGDFVTRVDVTGTVVAAHDADLGFAASGRISWAYAAVGDRVYAGQILAETENGDLVADVEQKQAKLDALVAGTRPEEIAVAESSVDSAQATLAATLASSYAVADDAVHNRTDAFFNNPLVSPSVDLVVTNTALKAKVERERADLERVFALWTSALFAPSASDQSRIAREIQGYEAQITAFLADANVAVNQAVPDQTTSAATISSYATSLATARANMNAAATALATDIAALDSAEKNLAFKKASATKDDIAAAAAEVRSARAALAKTRVVAPFSGIVTRMDAMAGEIVSPNVPEIAVQSDGLFNIETFVPEVAISAVAVGAWATTTLDAYGSSAPFLSKVVAIDPAETMKDGVPTYKTTLSFLSRDPRIRSGMTADVSITTGTLIDAIVIPVGTVGRGTAGKYVTAVVDGKKVNRPIETGITPSLGQVEVLSGLVTGDVLLLTPLTP